MTGKQEEQLFKLLTDILWTLKKIKKDRVVRSKPFNKSIYFIQMNALKKRLDYNIISMWLK